MECPEPEAVHFATALATVGTGACVAVGFHDVGRTAAAGCGRVHVRNSRFPERVVFVPCDRWEQLVADTQAAGKVVLAEWFPVELYGSFAASFTERERLAFESGVLGNEPQIVGRPAA